MALKAGYRGIKKYIADKLNRMNPGDSFATDAEIAAAFEEAIEISEEYTDDAIGWGSRNKLPYFTEIKQNSGVTVTPSNGRYTFTGTATNAVAIKYPVTIPINSGIYRFIADGYVPISLVNITLYYNDGGTVKALGPDETIDLSENTITDIAFFAGQGATANYQNIGLMLVEESAPDKSFELYHPSVADSLDEKANITALGTQEGATASRLYHPGEHFYKDGKFCTVIGSADVAAESTWTLNTNYVEGTIADCLKVQTYIDATTGIKLSKTNGVVTISFEEAGPFTSEADSTIFRLPEGYRPILKNSFRDTYGNIRIVLNTNGSLVTLSALENVYLRGGFTFVSGY